MSLDYRLSIASGLDSQQALTWVLRELGLTPATTRTAEGHLEETRCPGFLASANSTTALEGMILKEGVDILPTVNIHFTIDKFSDRAQAVTSMLQGVLALLRQEPGDAVLLFLGETVLLLRRHGRLFLDTRTGIWNPDRLELVRMPYTLEVLPTI